nr:ORF1 [Torque teno felis virus]
MAPYTRRRWRWRPRRNYYRQNRRRTYYKGRRFWKTRRSRPRRHRRVRRHRFFNRKRRLVTLFDPVSKAKCKIIGATIGLIAKGINYPQRCWYTMYTDKSITKLLTGGGVSLMTFSLRFLWDEHLHFRNIWTHTNDGFDLALYFGTKIFLKPHRTLDYAFFFDTDLPEEKPSDYMRVHPQSLLATKNVIWVRSQINGNNHRTKTVFIKPPANITTQWKFQYQWFDYPLFQYGFVFVNWHEPFLGQDDEPYQQLKFIRPSYQWIGKEWQEQTGGFAYCPLIDTGKSNSIEVTYLGVSVQKPSPDTKWTLVSWTMRMPYWLSCFGQNSDFNFSIPNDKPTTNTACWVRLMWPNYVTTDITQGKIPKQYQMWAIPATSCRYFAMMGPFVVDTYGTRANVPFIYKSYWKWGGTVLKQEPVSSINPISGQVSVKNPQTQVRSIIYPWDESGGLLTERALERFLEPSSDVDERRPLPFQTTPPRHVSPSELGEETEETEEGETQSDSELERGPTTKTLAKRLLREQLERKRMHRFLKSLLKPKNVTLI